MERKQVMVRTYPKGYINPTKDLKAYLSAGYKVVMCNKFKVDSNSEGNEYILEKEE